MIKIDNFDDRRVFADVEAENTEWGRKMERAKRDLNTSANQLNTWSSKICSQFLHLLARFCWIASRFVNHAKATLSHKSWRCIKWMSPQWVCGFHLFIQLVQVIRYSICLIDWLPFSSIVFDFVFPDCLIVLPERWLRSLLCAPSLEIIHQLHGSVANILF